MSKMKISILTPTYNRGKLLGRLYASLQKNKTVGIEIQWLIMDDGSTDETRQIIQAYQEENTIEINYYYQENQGKMQALNQLIPNATGELIIECDSDDYFKENAFQIIQNDVSSMDEATYALCYLKQDPKDANIGCLFPQKETTMFDLYFKQGEYGEKALVFQADIRKQYQYDLENKEEFVTEARMHHKMDLKYKIKCFNEPIMICEYQRDGYTNQITEIFKKNPYGYYEYFKEMFNMDWKGIYFEKRLYILKHYILFGILTNKQWKEIIQPVKGMGNKIGIYFLYLPGKWLTKRKFK